MTINQLLNISHVAHGLLRLGQCTALFLAEINRPELNTFGLLSRVDFKTFLTSLLVNQGLASADLGFSQDKLD